MRVRINEYLENSSRRNALGTDHADCIVLLWLCSGLVLLLGGHGKSQFADRFAESFRAKRIVASILVLVLVKFPLLTHHLLLLSQRTFPRTRNFASGRKAGFRVALLRRQIVIFNERLIVVVTQLRLEPVLDQPNLVGDILARDGLKLRWFLHDKPCGGDIAVTRISKRSW